MLGNPDTRKTTVARMLGKIYHQNGILSSGHLVEANRESLTSAHIGGTEKATQQLIEQVMGGVLFIDEAYSLASTDDADVRDFGHRVLDTLMPILSEPDKDIVVVMARYGKEMEKMLNSNRGLRSRFPIRYVFEDYTVDELMQMAQNYFDEFNYQLTLPAVEKLRKAFKEAKQHKSFGNGRFVSTLIENFILPAMASRVRESIDNCLNRSDLCILSTITAEDIPDLNAVKQMFYQVGGDSLFRAVISNNFRE